MKSTRTTRRGASAAITTVLAVTLGAGVLALPAGAASLPAAVTGDDAGAQAAPVAYPAKAFSFSAAGKTGFLTRGWEGGTRPVLKWTRFADGSTTTIDAPVADSTASDVVMTGQGQTPRRSLVVKLHDMAAGGTTVTIDLGALNGVYVKAVSRDTVLAEMKKADGSFELRLVTRTGTTVTQRKIEGIPSGASDITSTPARDGSVLVDYALQSGTPGTWRREYAVVDLAAAKVVSTHETDGASSGQGEFSALSATHLAWTGDGGKYYTVDRATGEESMTDLHLAEGERSAVGLLGTWAMYGTPGWLAGDGTGVARPLVPFTAKSLTSGETFKLLDYVNTAKPGPDNTLLVRGGTVEHGEGLYRISLGANGKPAAELVASTGEPTQLVHLATQIPPTVDLAAPRPLLKWKLSRENADVDLKITHRGTGTSFSKKLHLYSESAGSPFYYGNGVFGISWPEIAAESQMGKDAEVGTYDWSFTAHPQNGVGPDVEASGSFDAAKGLSSQHDQDLDGGPDLLGRDAQGVLWEARTEYDVAKKTLVPIYSAYKVGGGWQIYDRIETVGGIGPGAADFVARDKNGVLWLYDVTAQAYGSPIAARKQIGGGWNTYTQLAGGSDLNGDGRPDLVATDKAGALWLYTNTGNVNAPFAKRQKIGTGGWGIYNQITATGNIGGAAAGDLVARDKAGVLWLYLGKGDGTFAARKQIGGGWNAYTDTIGIGDANYDGRPDLYAYGPNNTGWFYAGTGDHTKPFAPRTSSPALTGDRTYNHVS
ncbi:FG-GAP repeat domain-containing protein [Streptomyces sp. NPDC056463]|uniref:FG-GAP repeat domain-containing protein n=1 Tax=Streptomyces sp. NPDC056463 TaxID=3345827 RepID=UPI00368BB22F